MSSTIVPNFATDEEQSIFRTLIAAIVAPPDRRCDPQPSNVRDQLSRNGLTLFVIAI